MSSYSDSFRNVTSYAGQGYRFVPTYIRPRDPNSPTSASNDIRPKEQQGKYVVCSLWNNSVNGNIWALAKITNNLANWVLISGGGSGPILMLTGDDGVAVTPTAGGVLNLNGLVVANATHAKAIFTESPGANTEKIDIQVSAAIAGTDITKVGLAAFNNTEFTVDANGFVGLVGGGSAIEKVNLQTGTTPIVPLAGAITFNGATVIAGTNPVRTDGTGANTMALEVQISQALAATDVTKIGLSNFDSARFTVDANGFVSINGAGIGETITGNSGGALSPTAGNWNIFGASTAAGTSPVTTTGAVSTLTINVQTAQAIAATDATKIGLCNFNSSEFTVDANGFVALVGGPGAAVTGLIPDAHTAPGTTPVVPTSGNITITGAQVATGTIGANVIRTDSLAANTMTIEIQRSTAVSSTDSTKNGVSHFTNKYFSVDTNAFTTIQNKWLVNAYASVEVAGGVPSIFQSNNFDSVTDNGVGTFTMNLTAAAVANTGYTASGSTLYLAGVMNIYGIDNGVTFSTSQFGVKITDHANNAADANFYTVVTGGV